jgi:hypothetical protein
VIGKSKVEKAQNAFEELSDPPNIKANPTPRGYINDWNFVRNI